MFETGWTCSVIWGDANYGDNYQVRWEGGEFRDEPHLVEVGLLHRSRELAGDPLGWVAAEQLNEILDWLQTLATDAPMHELSEWLAARHQGEHEVD